jgi:hypothetical protein
MSWGLQYMAAVNACLPTGRSPLTTYFQKKFWKYKNEKSLKRIVDASEAFSFLKNNKINT